MFEVVVKITEQGMRRMEHMETTNTEVEVISDWQPSTDHPGYIVKVIKHDYGIAEIYRPILSDQERKKREKHISIAVGRILANYYIRKEREACATELQSN